MFLSILFFGAAIILMAIQGSHKLVRVYASITGLLITVLSLTYLVSDYFTGNGIDESVIYHLQYGLDGAGFKEYSNLMLAVTAVIFCLVPLIFYANKWLSQISAEASRISSICGTLLLTAAIFSNAATRDLIALNLAAQSNFRVNSHASVYANTRVNISGEPLNLVYLYLESLERTYLDDTLFPGLTPNLKALEEKYMTFADIQQLPGTGWTIAGMTASQCGVPLVTKTGTNAGGEGNSMSGMPKFLPGAICIGDILKNIGYHLTYVGGAKLSFAGKGKFYKTHGFDLVHGKSELTNKLKPGKYVSPWGLYDDTLFPHTINLLANPEIREPFGLFLLTLDTHNPNGLPSASCKGFEYKDGSNSMLNAVHCSDHLVGKLIEKIQSLEIAKNTLIVIASDHLALRNTATDMLNRGHRRNLFIAIDPTSAESRLIDKPGSIFDVGVTTLNMIGVEISELGFGRNLLSDSKTLVESQSSPGDFLAGQRSYLRELWHYPDISDGISIDVEERRMMLKNQSVKLPAIIEIGNDLETTNIAFQFNAHQKLSQRIADFSAEQALVWVDECTAVRAFSITSQVDSDGLCIAAGKIGGESVLLRNLVEPTEVAYADLRAALLSKPVAEKITQVSKQLLLAAKFGEFPLPHITLPEPVGLKSTVSVFSSGHPLDGPSYILNDAIPNKMTENERGLSLIAISSEGEPKRLKNIDICKAVDDSQVNHNFDDLINSNGDKTRVFIIMTNHLAKCVPNQETIAFYFQKLAFKQWSDIGERRSFIGVLVDRIVKFEKIGKVDGHLALQIRTELHGA